jgi:hypothetical protein
MAEETGTDLIAEIDERLADLAAARKSLEKRSTIAFVERRDLSARAARAAAELRERRGELEGAADASEEGEPAKAARAALEGADGVLSRIHAAQPARTVKGGPLKEERRMPGQARQSHIQAREMKPSGE